MSQIQKARIKLLNEWVSVEDTQFCREQFAAEVNEGLSVAAIVGDSSKYNGSNEQQRNGNQQKKKLLSIVQSFARWQYC
jgi:hypothetical protein